MYYSNLIHGEGFNNGVSMDMFILENNAAVIIKMVM